MQSISVMLSPLKNCEAPEQCIDQVPHSVPSFSSMNFQTFKPLSITIPPDDYGMEVQIKTEINASFKPNQQPLLTSKSSEEDNLTRLSMAIGNNYTCQLRNMELGNYGCYNQQIVSKDPRQDYDQVSFTTASIKRDPYYQCAYKQENTKKIALRHKLSEQDDGPGQCAQPISNNRKTARKQQPPPVMPEKNGHGVFFAPSKNRFNLAKLNLSGMRTPEPDTSNEDNINSLDYVRKYLSNTLVLPPNDQKHTFDHNDLKKMEVLGNGSFGVVRKMLHQPSSVEMAVKIITLINNGPDETFNKSMQRFRLEVEATKSASNCEEIVKYYGITFHEGDAWMCMELMDLSLDKLYMISHDIEKVAIPEQVLGAVAVATIKALEHLKTTHHIIHRDIKPSNILLHRNGCVKLCDFGICGYLQNSVAQSVDVGCRPYMAPERLAPNSDGYDIKSEVWSLGITMVEVANGKYPYKGFSDAPILEQVRMVVYGDPPILNSDHGISMQMKAFVGQCTIKDRYMRASFEDLKKTNIYKDYSRDDHKVVVGEFVAKMFTHRFRLVPFENF
uniref:mitogen-activated protein kinase kinase n=2 Tax=Caenorhabditis japonica TaxID=281687 RepID=A0A8R1DJ70_CAEJA